MCSGVLPPAALRLQLVLAPPQEAVHVVELHLPSWANPFPLDILHDLLEPPVGVRPVIPDRDHGEAALRGRGHDVHLRTALPAVVLRDAGCPSVVVLGAAEPLAHQQDRYLSIPQSW